MSIGNIPDWTTKDGRANSSDQFKEIAGHIADLIRGSAHSLICGQTESVAALILAQLAHVHNLEPRDYHA